MPNCQLFGAYMDRQCRPLFHTQASMRVAYQGQYGNSSSSIGLGMEYRQFLTGLPQSSSPIGTSELLMTASAVTISPSQNGSYLQGGLSIDLIRSFRVTKATWDMLSCNGPCDGFEGMGMVLGIFSPLVGLVGGAGVELGVGYRTNGLGVGVLGMADLYKFGAEVRASYLVPQ